MTADTLTLAGFLLARIAEDEEVARKILGFAPTRLDEGEPWYCDEQSDHVAMAPARVLAECEAKRRIVEAHTPVDDEPDAWCNTCDGDGWPCVTMAALALPYADHPDYREEWKP